MSANFGAMANPKYGSGSLKASVSQYGFQDGKSPCAHDLLCPSFVSSACSIKSQAASTFSDCEEMTRTEPLKVASRGPPEANAGRGITAHLPFRGWPAPGLL